MTTRYTQAQLVQELMQLNERLARLEQQAAPQDTAVRQPEATVYQLLIQLGIPSSLCGFHYLKCAVLMAYEQPAVMRKVTARLYPEIGKRFQTTGTRVERGMRHAIEVAWRRGDYEIQNIVFASSFSAEKGKPTNSEFICAVVEYLKHI